MKNDRKIALEEHFAMSDTLRESHYHGVFGERWQDFRRRLLDLHEERLSEMDRHGIEFVILSLNSPAVQAVPDLSQAVEMAQRANDILADAVAKRPDRFAAFAALPMQDPEAAIVELSRCVDEMRFKGVLVNGFSQIGSPDAVVYLDDPRYLPFWAELERRDVPFYLHPRDPLLSREPIYEGHPWFLGSNLAFGIETLIHALRLMASGLFDRYPALKIILGHLGEALPATIWRIDHRIAKAPRGIPARRRLSDYLCTNFFITTSGNFRTSVLTNAMMEMGADRILFSVDYPFEDTVDAVTWFDNLPISENDQLKIGRTNARQLFGLSNLVP